MKMVPFCCDMAGLAAEIPIGYVLITYFKEHCDCCRLTAVPQMKGEDRKEWGRTPGGMRVTEDTCR